MTIAILITAAISFVIAVVITKMEIPFLRRKAGQNIREEGLKSHYSKAGTPSMGGISIIIATCVSALIGLALAHDARIVSLLIILLVFVGFGFVGFLDDYLKVIKKQNEGFKVKPKFAVQMIIAIAFGVIFRMISDQGSLVYIPGVDTYVDFGILYVPFIVFAVLAMTNAVNLTDGLDGLAGGVTALVAAAFVIAGLTFSRMPNGIMSDQIPGIVFFDRLTGAWRRGRSGGDRHEAGAASPDHRAALCDRSALRRDAGRLFQDDAWQADLQDGSDPSPFRNVWNERNAGREDVLGVHSPLQHHRPDRVDIRKRREGNWENEQ